MSDGRDFLARIIGALNEASIPHMVAGSFASTHHGVPRTTQDIDVIIDPTTAALEKFVANLKPEAYYVSADAARDALRQRGMFNVIDMGTGWKVDLIVRKARPFSVEEFHRRTPARLLGVDVFIATPEDTILSKLEWASMSGSERQLRDVAGVVEVRRDTLDLDYVERWANALGVIEAWRKVLNAT